MKGGIRELLCELSDRQLDQSMINIVKTWSESPTSLQILEVLDKSIHDSLASSFVVATLQALYDIALKEENIKHEDNIPLALWRTWD